MAPQRHQLNTFSRSLRPRYQTLVQQLNIELFDNDFKEESAARLEYTAWEYSWMTLRPVFVALDGCFMIVATLGALLQQENRYSPMDLALWISFITITLLGWILHMSFRNDCYVRIRQWFFTIMRLAIATGLLIWESKILGNIPFLFSIGALVSASLGLLVTASGSYIRTKRQRRRLGFERQHP